MIFLSKMLIIFSLFEQFSITKCIHNFSITKRRWFNNLMKFFFNIPITSPSVGGMGMF